MRLLLNFVSLLSFSTAHVISRGGSGTKTEPGSDRFHWECGQEAPVNALDCAKILDWFKTVSKTSWFGIGKDKTRDFIWDSCKVIVESGPLGYFALEIQQDEFYKVLQQGMMSICVNDGWRRVLVKPHNNTWTAFITERDWEIGQPL
ncbi:hypothetical protein F53441_4286 [Fusarium austroafricanum]|uniref:Ecp2 effector protein domain-containing protein n=1 Tax=Fusarium austroafricanum TaxID=2364996 RepID=A0A8H4KKP6_9HYPO|nr:hypothetical protein F53441_4286 [Fusarium austroafricanum]